MVCVELSIETTIDWRVTTPPQGTSLFLVAMTTLTYMFLNVGTSCLLFHSTNISALHMLHSENTSLT